MFKRSKKKAAKPDRIDLYHPSDASDLRDSDRKFRRRKKPGHRKLIIFVCCLIVAGLGGLAYLWFGSPDSITPTDLSKQIRDEAARDAPPTRIRLLAAGDIVPEPSMVAAAKTETGYDFAPLFEEIADTFEKADMRFCSSPMIAAGEAFGISGAPLYNAPTQLVDGVIRGGCNMINTASNHTFDKGQKAIDASVRLWQKNGVLAAYGANNSPAEHRNIRYVNIHDVRFAFLSYTTASNVTPENDYGVNLFDREWVRKQFVEAKHYGADIIIVSMHWNDSGSAVSEQQKSDASYLAAQGADLILGHGPQAVQTVQEIPGSDGHKALVWYSLGSFLNPAASATNQVSGLAAIDFDIARQKITKLQYIPTYLEQTDGVMRVRFLQFSTMAQTAIQAHVDRLTATLTSAGRKITLTTASEY